MSNSTTPVELNTILQTIIKPNYPGAVVDNYYVFSTMLPTAPTSNPDRIMQYLTEQILFLRNPAGFNYAAPLSDADVCDLYADISRILGDTITVLTTVKTAIDAKVTDLGC